MSRHDRDRSRDKQGYRGRSQSPPESNDKKKKSHTTRISNQSIQKSQSKRVKFNDAPDIKIFRKQDQPNSKGLTQAELEEYMKKIQAQRGSGSFSSSNSQRMRHFDALLQQNSIKEQRQKEKILNEKLQAARQQISFYCPLLFSAKNIVVPGQGSKEKVDLSNRLNDVLGCFYVQQSQIPSEPSFQIQNKSTALQPKLINFDKQRIDNKDLNNTTKKKQKKDQKPIKGILKMSPEERARQRSQSAPRKIDPALINLLKQMQINKAAYPKQRAQILLKPYKDSGQLDYLKNNPSMLTNLMRSSSVPTDTQKLVTKSNTSLPDPYKQRYSISPQPEKPPQMKYQPQHEVNSEMNKPAHIGQYNNYNQPNYPNNYNSANQYGYYSNYPSAAQPIPPAQNPSMMNMYNSNPTTYPSQQNSYNSYSQPNPQQQQQQQMYMISRNFRTVPCKYYHSPQGCVKATNCTFIHEQEYAGKPTPSMLKSNRGMVMTNYTPNSSNYAQAPNDNSQMGNFYAPYPNDGYQGQN